MAFAACIIARYTVEIGERARCRRRLGGDVFVFRQIGFATDTEVSIVDAFFRFGRGGASIGSRRLQSSEEACSPAL